MHILNPTHTKNKKQKKIMTKMEKRWINQWAMQYTEKENLRNRIDRKLINNKNDYLKDILNLSQNIRLWFSRDT